MGETIIDPACGSGGFLVYSLKHISDKFPKEDGNNLSSKIKDFSRNYLYGIEINERISKVALIDMILHNDGSSNIICSNSLEDYKKIDRNGKITPKKFSMLFTNPPFGSIIRESKIVNNFQLGKNLAGERSEVLFIERCLDLLKDHGKLGIVLPDSILTNLSLQHHRCTQNHVLVLHLHNHYNLQIILLFSNHVIGSLREWWLLYQ